jgi:hypothetical protein
LTNVVVRVLPDCASFNSTQQLAHAIAGEEFTMWAAVELFTVTRERGARGKEEQQSVNKRRRAR